MLQYSQMPSKGWSRTIRSFRFAMPTVYAVRAGVQGPRNSNCTTTAERAHALWSRSDRRFHLAASWHWRQALWLPAQPDRIAPVKADPGWVATAWLSRMRRHIEARRIRHRSRGGSPARSDAQFSVAGRLSCSGGGPALSNRRSRKPGLRGGHRMVEPAANPPGAYRRQT